MINKYIRRRSNGGKNIIDRFNLKHTLNVIGLYLWKEYSKQKQDSVPVATQKYQVNYKKHNFNYI